MRAEPEEAWSALASRLSPELHELLVRLPRVQRSATNSGERSHDPAPQTLVVDARGGTPYRSILSAMQVARAGDVILLNAGVYHEFVVMKNGIRLVGVNRRECIISWMAGDCTVLVPAGVIGVGIENLTISVGSGPGILIDGGRARIQTCNVDGGWIFYPGVLVQGERGGAIVRDNLFRRSASSVEVNHGARAVIVGNTIEDCATNGISVSGRGTRVLIDRNVIRRSRQWGVSISEGASALIRHNTIDDHLDGAIHVWGLGTTATMMHNHGALNNFHGVKVDEASGARVWQIGNSLEPSNHRQFPSRPRN